MASVSGSDRARYEERVKDIREEYETKDAKNTKKKNQELNKMQQKHAEEVRNISRTHDEQLDSLRERNREVINERDVKNQKKIEDLRKIYVDSLRRKTEESDQLRSAQREAYEGQIEEHKEISESQKANQIKKFNDIIAEKSKNYAEDLEENRQEAQQSVQRNSARINNSHEGEKRDIVESFQKQKKAQDRLNDEIKDTFQKESVRQQEARGRDNEKWASRYEETIRQFENDRTNAIAADQFKQEREAVREKYQTALQHIEEDMSDNYEQFERNVNDRVNRQVLAKGIENQRLKNDLNSEKSNNTRLRRLEREHLQAAYEEKIKDLERQKDETKDVFKNLTDKRVGQVIDNSQKIFRQARRDQMEKMNDYVARSRQDQEMKESLHKDLVSHLKSTTDKRIEKIRNQGFENQIETERYYNDSVEVLKDGYSEKLDLQREKNAKELARSNSEMTAKLREIEERLGNRLDQTVASYEKRLKQKDEERKKEVASVKKQYEVRLEDLAKNTEDQKAMVEAKYESKISELNESHRDQIQRISQRHEEDLQNIAVRYNNFSRKA